MSGPSNPSGRSMPSMKIQKAVQGGSRLRLYGELVVGSSSLWRILVYEAITGAFGALPGLPGLFLRSKLYPLLLGRCGRGIVIGRNVTLRHPGKVFLGDGVVIDDGATIDAKGNSNRGISLGDGVYIGRNTIVYCKDGDIELGERANVAHNCQLFSAGSLVLGAGVLVAAYSYLMSGGGYDVGDPDRPPIDQEGHRPSEPTVIGKHCWIGAHVVVLDGASIGEGSVVAAGGVVTKPLPAGVVAAGVPARVVRSLAGEPAERAREPREAHDGREALENGGASPAGRAGPG